MTVTARFPGRLGTRRMSLKHRLMLALAVEVLLLGLSGAWAQGPRGITVDQTPTEGNVIT